MGQIDKIIEQHYKEMATTVYNDGHFNLSQNGEKILNDIFISAIHDNFFELLDSVINLLTNINDPKLSEDHRKAILLPSKDYYCGLSLFNDNKLKLFSVLEKYSDNRDNCIEQLKKRLNRAIPISRIAELVYYKMCHRYYNKGIESAFRGVVHGVTLNSNSVSGILNKRMANRIQRTTASIAREQLEKLYTEIYGNHNLMEKYRMDKSELVNMCACFFTENSKPTGIAGYAEKYADALADQINDDTLLTINDAFQRLPDIPVSENDIINSCTTYRKYFNSFLMPLAGLSNAKMKKYNVKNKFIIEPLINDLNTSILFLYKKFKDQRDIYLPEDLNNGTLSRFKYIDSLDSFYKMGDLIRVVMQMLIARRLNKICEIKPSKKEERKKEERKKEERKKDISSGLNMLPMDLSITIKYAESELKKSSNRAIIDRYRKQNQNIFTLLPDFCDSIVSERIIDDASDPNVVKQMGDLVELGIKAGVIQ